MTAGASECIWKRGITGKGVARPEKPQPEGGVLEEGAGSPLRASYTGAGERCKLVQWCPGSPCRLIVLLYFTCSRWLLLLHFRVYFEREQ